METAGNALRMRIYIGEFDQWRHQPLYEALLMTAKREGIAGASVFKGIAGFGAHSRVHTTTILRLSEDLPVLVEFVDQPERIAHIRPFIDAMVHEGLVTIDPVEVMVYRSRELRPLPPDLRVRDLMHAVTPVPAEAPVTTVARMLADIPDGIVPVVEEGSGRVLGVITNTDLIERAGMPLRSRVMRDLREHGHPLPEVEGPLESLTARRVMTTPAGVIAADRPAWEAAEQMATSGLKALPAVDEQQRFVGMVSRVDVLRTVSDTLINPPMAQGAATLVANEGRVAEIMRTDAPTVRPETPIPEVLDRILASPIHRVLVTDAARRVIGIIGDVDLVARLQPEARQGFLQRLRGGQAGEREMRALSRQTAETVMHRELVTIDSQATLAEALMRMLDLHLRLLPVVDAQQHLVGYVARDLLLAALITPDNGDDDAGESESHAQSG